MVRPMPQPDRTSELTAALAERILVLDGAMGTTIRAYGLKEEDARGQRFTDTTRICSTTATSSA